MEDNSSVRGPCLPLLSLRLLVPPLRLVSAAISQTVKQNVRRDYGILDEFITMVTEIVPELLQVRERSLLSLGLRAQLVLELCRSEQPADLKTIQPHLKIVQTLTTLLSTTTEANYLLATLSKCNFVGFIETLLKDTEKKEHFYQDVYPEMFGSRYDEAIQILMGQFLKRLENLLPIPNLQQASSMLGCVPNPLEECMESVSNSEGLKTLLEYHKDLIQLDDDDHSIPSLEDNILSALCLSVNDHEVNGSGLPISTLTDHMYSSNQKLMVDSATLTAGEEDEGVVKEEIETEKQSVYITEVAQNSEVTHIAEQQQKEFQSLPEHIVVWESSLPEVQIGANSEVCDEGLESKEEETLVKDVEVVYETDWLIGEDCEMEPLNYPILNEESIEGVESSSAIDRFVKEESEEISCGPEFLGQVKSIIVTDALISSMLQKPRVKLKRLDPSVAFSFTALKSFPNEAPKKMDSRKVSINSKRLTLKSCPVCGSTFSRVSELRLHQKSHKVSALPRFSCSMCKKRFRYMYDLKIHKVNLCQENVPDPHPSPSLTSSPAKKRLRGPRECSVCEKTIRNHSYFVRHMKSHSEERPHRCLLCNKGYKGIHNLKLHSEKCTGPTSKSEHESDEEDNSAETPCPVIPGKDRLIKDLRNLDCKVCGKTFPYPSVLRRHIQRTHLGVSLFECSKCSEQFTIQSDLAKHQLDVCQGSVPQPEQKTSKKLKDKTTLKSRKCGVCGKIFAKPSQLQYHMITHNDERPYKCTYCEKTFKYITNFRMHGEVCQPAGDKAREDFSVGRAPPATDQNDAQSSSNSILLSNSQQNQLTLEEKTDTHSEIPNDLNETENVGSCKTALSLQDLENGPGQIEVCTHPADRNKDRKDTESAFGVTISKPSRRSRGKKSTIETDDTSSEVCLICKLLVKGSMKCHLRSHSDMSPYSCPHCKVKFRFKNDLRKHMKGEHDHADAETLKKIERSLKCDECGKEFMFIRTLRQHKYTHNPLYCIECKRLFPSMAAFSTHRLMHKPRPCMICLENLNGLTQLNKHYLEVHEYRGPFACTSCERSYTDLKGLIIHERVHTGELPFKCPECPKSFNYPFTLAIHIKTHTEEKPFLCWDCGKCYRNPGALRSHRLSFHGSDKDKRCICSHCGITFALKGNLNKHVAKEHAGVRYPCTYCGKLFLSASSLTRHDLIHTQERPYPCTECDKSFRSASELKIHTRYHTGERPFKCEQCGKGFTQSYHLTDHRRMHTGEKPYQCPTCERYFRSAKVLKKHKMTHTGEKPYKCSVCDMAYSRMNLLKTHVRKSH